MVVDPKLMPFSFGCTAGVVCPARIVRLAGVTVALEGSLLDSVTVTPPGGAGAGKVTGNGTDCPTGTLVRFGRIIWPALLTMMLAVVSATFGSALAWRVAVPTAIPVTGTVTLVALAAMVAVEGTVAALGV